jgi:glutathione synthase/RimK-type ligase-like ATP-grasp enzyme
MKFVILKNEFDDGHLNWASACKKYNVQYKIVDITNHSWLEDTLHEPELTAYLACPPGRQALFKELYDERIYILDKVLGQFVYPSYDEISVHENKKYLSYWLKANHLPHPATFVFYHKDEALRYIEGASLPIIAKMSIGASGKGVHVFKSRDNAVKYIDDIFGKGVRSAWGPNMKMGNFWGRLAKIIKNPSRLKKRIQVYKMVYNEVQKGFCIFQEYIKHDYEWRVVKIGDSYFGHKKVKQEDKASGTKGILYDTPPVDLLNFVGDLCEEAGFNSMAVDLFEDGKVGYLINELQCIFGHVQEYICEKDGNPGRFLKKNKNWHFEEGYFNSNLSYDLRLENVIELVS